MDKKAFDNAIVEALAKTFHNLQQQEAIRQGNESPIDYNEMEETSKEYIRVPAKYIVARINKMLDTLEFYAKEENWNTVVESKDKFAVKDGIVFDDMGKTARELLASIGLEGYSKDKSGDTK